MGVDGTSSSLVEQTIILQRLAVHVHITYRIWRTTCRQVPSCNGSGLWYIPEKALRIVVVQLYTSCPESLYMTTNKLLFSCSNPIKRFSALLDTRRHVENHAPICKPLLRERKFSQFMSNHVLCHDYRQVFFAVMYIESDASVGKRSQSQGSFSEDFRETYPTKLGRMVHDLACVFMGVWFARASRRLGNGTK